MALVEPRLCPEFVPSTDPALNKSSRTAFPTVSVNILLRKDSPEKVWEYLLSLPYSFGILLCIQAESQRPVRKGFGEQETARTFFRMDCSDNLLRDGAKDSSWILYKASCRSRTVAEGPASALLVSLSRIVNTFTSLKINKDLRIQDLKAVSLLHFLAMSLLTL